MPVTVRARSHGLDDGQCSAASPRRAAARIRTLSLTRSPAAGRVGPGLKLAAAAGVNASITDNQITAGGDTDILLTTAGDTTNWPVPGGGVVVTPASQRPVSIDASSSVDLQNINNGATVGTIVDNDSINFNPALVPPLPPPPPTPP